MAFYADKGGKLPSLRLQYKDFACWQNSDIQREAVKKQEEYWLRQFAGEIPVLHLPADYLRPAVQSFEGRTLSFEIGEKETAALNRLALAENTSLYIVLLSLYTIFLARITGQEDIVIGTPIAGRRHADVQPIIGMFVNTLGIRNYLEGQETVSGFLQEVKERALESFENQDYPFEDLVENLELKRDVGRNPLFDVMFTLQNMERTDIEIPGLKLMPYNYEKKTSKFDLTLRAVESESRLQFIFEYCTKLFREETVERFTYYFRRTVTSVLRSTGQEIWEIEILAEAEKRLLLEEFNNTGAEYPRDKTIHELFEAQAAGTPDRVAVIGVERRMDNVFLTYKELNKKSGQLALILREKGVKPGAIVDIMVERSLEMMVGIFAILKAGGAYLPIEVDCPGDRIDYMFKDSNAKVLMKKSEIRNPKSETNPNDRNSNDRNEVSPGIVLDLEHLNFEFLNGCPSLGFSNYGFRASDLSPSNLAYVMYTSGSTGRPKGVMVEHRNVVNLVWGLWERIYKKYIGAQKVALVAPYVFDASVKQIFASVLLGHTLYIVPEETRIDGAGLIEFYRKHRIEISDGTPTHLRLMKDAAGGETPYRGLDTRHFIIGGEPLPRGVVEAFLRGFPGDGNRPLISNVYGPTECCVDSTSFDVSAETLRLCRWDIIPIGNPMPNEQILILDNNNSLQPMGVPGELCIAGDGVSRGYLNRPELTAEKFYPVFYRSYRSYRTCIPKKIYKTGDLARWLADGNIEYLGRMDYQVKIRGFRIELGEIEHQLLLHEEIKETVVVVRRDKNEDNHLCAYVVTCAPHTAESLQSLKLGEYLSRQLPAYMVPTWIIPLERIPLTPSGKVDRKALPEPGFTRVELQKHVAPVTLTEKKLAEIWADILDVEQENIGIEDGFFALGGHSLKATVLTAKIHKEFNIRISLTEIFKNPTIRELAAVISTAEKVDFIDLHKVEAREYYELSFNQRRLWIVNRFNPGSAAYNMPGRVLFQHKIEEDVLKRVLLQIVKRHEAFRTGFKTVRNEPVQFLVDEEELTVPFKKVDLSSLGDKEKLEKREETFNEEVLVPFDLTRAPLLRTVLVKLDEERYEFIFNMHHIISDGWSLEIIKKDFSLLYEVEGSGHRIELEPLKFQYKDFAAWQNKKLKDPVLKENSHRYWKEKLTGRLSSAGLPVEYGETAGAEDTGEYRCVITGALKDRLNQLVRDNNTSLFILMFSVFNILLARFRGQKDILCGIPAAGRDHYSLNNLVGFFVNTLILHNRVDYEINFTDFLRNVGENTLVALQHQGYPLELVLDDLNMNFPRIDVFFNMLNLGPDLEKEKYTPAVPVNEYLLWKSILSLSSFLSITRGNASPIINVQGKSVP
jgi:fengycin family lipopeptide synthetase D